jgi:hypothetical protein
MNESSRIPEFFRLLRKGQREQKTVEDTNFSGAWEAILESGPLTQAPADPGRLRERPVFCRKVLRAQAIHRIPDNFMM